jgi:hypothetical protein
MKYQRRIKQIVLLQFFLILLAIMQGCNIKEPTAPNWDVTLNIPITAKNYTLFDIIEKKTSLVQHYTQGTDLNLLYYSDIRQIDKLTLTNKLKIDDFTKTESATMGPLNVNSDSVGTQVGFNWISSQVTPGSQSIVPPVNPYNLSSNFGSAGQFQTVTIQSGSVDLKITNYFPSPVSINMSGFYIKNRTDGSIVLQYTAPVTIQPSSTYIIKSIPLTQGITVENQLLLQCIISTDGSGGQSITIPNNSIGITSFFHDLKVSQATAIIPNQNPVVVDGTALIDDGDTQPNKFTYVNLNSGNLNVSITNNLNLDANYTLTLDNLQTKTGAVFTSSGSIARKSTKNAINNLSLSGYSLVSGSGSPTNQVVYHITFNWIPSNDYRTVSSTDGVSGTIDAKSIIVNQFTGQMKPTTIDPVRTAVSLSVQDIQNKLTFQQINIKNPKIELHLHPSADVEFSINGRIEAKNSIGQRNVMSLSASTLNKSVITFSDSIVSLNSDSVSNFFKAFSKFPDSLIVYAGGVANPNYKTISVKSSDQVTGSGHLEFPFQFGLLGGIYTDSVKVDLSQDDRDKIKNVITMNATLSITNGVAASIDFSGKLYDNNNKFLMNFPPKYTNPDQDSVLTVAGASTDANGDVSVPNIQSLSVRTSSDDTPKISNAAYMRVRIRFNTSSPGNQPVRFKTDDVIKISAFGSTDYNVKPN